MNKLVKKLSIGIPTYNNHVGLEAELECIFSQIKDDAKLKESIEILVSDNSDNEESSRTVNNFAKKIPEITYLKNKINIGFDRNVDQILTKSTGLFCWTLSDNDLISDGGIKKIIETIDIYPNIAHIVIDTSGAIEERKVFENMEKIIKENNYEIIGGLISQNIFNKKLLPTNRFQYYDNFWFHLSVALESGSKGKVALIPNLLNEKPNGECSWAKDGFTFTTYTNLQSIVMNLRNFGYSEDFLNNYHCNFIKGLPRQVASCKLYGLKFNKQSLSTLYKYTRNNQIIFLLCLFILITPVCILKTAKNIWKKL